MRSKRSTGFRPGTFREHGVRSGDELQPGRCYCGADTRGLDRERTDDSERTIDGDGAVDGVEEDEQGTRVKMNISEVLMAVRIVRVEFLNEQLDDEPEFKALNRCLQELVAIPRRLSAADEERMQVREASVRAQQAIRAAYRLLASREEGELADG
jgi:hypothetical protein